MTMRTDAKPMPIPDCAPGAPAATPAPAPPTPFAGENSLREMQGERYSLSAISGKITKRHSSLELSPNGMVLQRTEFVVDTRRRTRTVPVVAIALVCFVAVLLLLVFLGYSPEQIGPILNLLPR